MKLEDDIRAALRELADTHDVVMPAIDELVRAPYATAGSRPARRRALIGVAAAALAVALGVAAIALTGHESTDPTPPAATVSEPTAGTHGAVLVGVGPPVDGDEMPWDPPQGASAADPADDAPLVVLAEAAGDGTAVVTFVAPNADTSFDMPAWEGPTPIEVGGRPAVRYAPNPLNPELVTLEVDGGDGERLFVAGRGLDEAALVELGAAALGAADPLAGWWPDELYRATYAGPDRNPFSRLVGDERRLAYEIEGRPAVVTFQAGSADPVDYVWFFDGGTVAHQDGHRIVRWVSDGEVGPMAAWAVPGGIVVVGAAEADLEAAIAAVRMVDATTWEAERASATAPGSRYQHEDATTTTG